MAEEKEELELPEESEEDQDTPPQNEDAEAKESAEADNNENTTDAEESEVDSESEDDNTDEGSEEVSTPQQIYSQEQGVSPQNIVHEMQDSFLSYAMSVIVARALPDVRDGLKPVHRRILYAMHEQGLHFSSKHKKSAKVVGEVLGKYHPHGDSAVYESMVRMAQDFSLRYPLIDGQGNFGSIDGDSAAAMRYTEARMQKIADHLLADIEKDTVDFMDNYDASESEPVWLPTRIPQLLLNGSEGIAVGMATKIPPHNLSELIDGLIYLIDTPEATVEELMEYITGPDFPTGGIIYGGEGIKDAYMTGKGRIVMRGKASIQELKSNKSVIIIDEIPYQVNKASLIEKIANLVQAKKLVGISDLRDESDKDGMRIVVELKRDAYPKKILNQLFKFTQLQSSFNVNMIALVDGLQPKLLNLKSVLEYFVIHRKEVVTRRTEYELKVAKARAHILEGLKIALDHIDEIIATIRGSETKEDARDSLIEKFKLSELQAKAILEMRLQALAGLERQKVENEYQEKLTLITTLEGILADETKIFNIIKEELLEIREKYGDDRRTKIFQKSIGDFSDEDLIPNEPAIITLTKGNYIKRVAPSSYRSQHRGGKGIAGMTTKEDDKVMHILSAMAHDEVWFFTDLGRVFRLKVYELTQTSRTAKGDPIVNLINLAPEEHVTSMRISSTLKEDKYLFMCTEKGTVKKVPREAFKNVRASGLIAIKLKDNDKLRWVKYTSGNDEIFIVSKNGQSIRFDENNVRAMGRAAAGVRGIRLKGDDKVVEMQTISGIDNSVLIISEGGYGKRTMLTQFSPQNRGGSGVRAFKVTKKTKLVVGAHILTPDEVKSDDLIMISKQGQVMRTPCKSTPALGRSTQGVILMRLKAKDAVSSFEIFSKAEVEGPKEEDKKVKTENEKEVKKAVASESKPKKEKVVATKKATPKKSEKPAPKMAKKEDTKKPAPKKKSSDDKEEEGPTQSSLL